MVSKFRREAPRVDWKDDAERGAMRGGDLQDHHLWRLKVREVPSITPCARSTKSLVFEELFFKSEALTFRSVGCYCLGLFYPGLSVPILICLREVDCHYFGEPFLLKSMLNFIKN